VKATRVQSQGQSPIHLSHHRITTTYGLWKHQSPRPTPPPPTYTLLLWKENLQSKTTQHTLPSTSTHAPMTSRDHRSRNASPQFRSIKAVFEQANAPITPPRPFSRASRPQTPTDDEPSPVASLISRETFKHQQETIDTLLEASSTRRWPTPIPTPAPRDPLRPKSSWIGPPPPARLPSFQSDYHVFPPWPPASCLHHHQSQRPAVGFVGDGL
jgi:hypothetical protein